MFYCVAFECEVSSMHGLMLTFAALTKQNSTRSVFLTSRILRPFWSKKSLITLLWFIQKRLMNGTQNLWCPLKSCKPSIPANGLPGKFVVIESVNQRRKNAPKEANCNFLGLSIRSLVCRNL